MLRVALVWLALGAVGGERRSVQGEAVVAILKGEVERCAGTVVDAEKYVHLVTAAHCVFGVPNSALRVRLSRDGEAQQVIRVIVHPYYAPPSPEYDIAVVRVKKQSDLQLESLPLVKVQAKGEVQAVSWDWKQEGSSPTRVAAAVHERKSCGEKLKMVVSSRMVCADVGSGSVPGGGPLLKEPGVVGVRSQWPKGNNGTLPKVFTNIANSEIYSFIERHI